MAERMSFNIPPNIPDEIGYVDQYCNHQDIEHAMHNLASPLMDLIGAVILAFLAFLIQARSSRGADSGVTAKDPKLRLQNAGRIQACRNMAWGGS